jgi:hypothetical protein
MVRPLFTTSMQMHRLQFTIHTRMHRHHSVVTDAGRQDP